MGLEESVGLGGLFPYVYLSMVTVPHPMVGLKRCRFREVLLYCVHSMYSMYPSLSTLSTLNINTHIRTYILCTHLMFVLYTLSVFNVCTQHIVHTQCTHILCALSILNLYTQYTTIACTFSFLPTDWVGEVLQVWTVVHLLLLSCLVHHMLFLCVLAAASWVRAKWLALFLGLVKNCLTELKELQILLWAQTLGYPAWCHVSCTHKLISELCIHITFV